MKCVDKRRIQCIIRSMSNCELENCCGELKDLAKKELKRRERDSNI